MAALALTVKALALPFNGLERQGQGKQSVPMNHATTTQRINHRQRKAAVCSPVIT